MADKSQILPPPLSGRRILVVEDEYFQADDMARLLRGLGAEVVGPIGEVQDALELLDTGKPVDMAVLDINLKGEMIYPAADVLRSRAIPFVFTSGYDRGPIPDQYRDVPLLEKPVDEDAVSRTLRQLFRELTERPAVAN
jgi:CheY-like chemotaxis protein